MRTRARTYPQPVPPERPKGAENDPPECHQAADNGIFFCSPCKVSYSTKAKLDSHRKSYHDFPCGDCGRLFDYTEILRQHQRDSRHCFCEICDRFFSRPEKLMQHRHDDHGKNTKYRCGDCGRLFDLSETLRQHQRDSRHCFCEICERFFSRPEKLMQHQHDDHGKNTEYRCCDCDKEFISEYFLNLHLATTIHNTEPTPPPRKIPECTNCERAFKTEHDLAQHLASLKHNPLSNIPCVASKKCKKKFTSPSALAHHLESGKCRSGITRKKLNAAIQATDHQRLITSAPTMRLLSDTDTSAGTRTPLRTYTPDTDSTSGVPLSPGLFTPSSTRSSEGALPPNPLACPLCPRTLRPFRSATALENHLASPAHDAKIFSCPSILFTDVEVPIVKRFTTLSGLTQHLESGACVGGKETLRRAVKLVEEKLKGMGFSWQGVRLLL